MVGTRRNPSSPRRGVGTPRRPDGDTRVVRAASPAAAAAAVSLGLVSPSTIQQVPHSPRQSSPLNPNATSSCTPVCCFPLDSLVYP